MTTITVDYASRFARVSGGACLGELIDVQVYFETGGADEDTAYTEAEIVLFDDDNNALTVAPALDAQWRGTINTATNEARDLFANKKSRDKITLTVAIRNATDKHVLGIGPFTMLNNPFVFASESVNEMLVAEFGARVAALEARSGKVPRYDDIDEWVALYASETDGIKSLTFEVPA